jgi:hypothetical protein
MLLFARLQVKVDLFRRIVGSLWPYAAAVLPDARTAPLCLSPPAILPQYLSWLVIDRGGWPVSVARVVQDESVKKLGGERRESHVAPSSRKARYLLDRRWQ